MYLAFDYHLEKYWAVKVITQKNEEIYRERDVLKNLEHTSLPRIADILIQEDKIFLVMDYIEGKTVDTLIKTHQKISEKQILCWSLKLCDVLKYLHGQNPPIIYRDMKPSNIIVRDDGTLKLIDFGLAKLSVKSKKESMDFWGTKGYAAPEQYQGQCTVRTDLYGLGAVIDSMVKNAGKGVVRNRGLSKICRKCMQADPQRRYEDAEELEKDLKVQFHILERNCRLRRLGILLALAGALLAVSSFFIQQKEKRLEMARQQEESILNQVRKGDYEALMYQLEQFSGDIDWNNALFCLNRGVEMVKKQPDSTQKADELLHLASVYLSYEEEWEELGINAVKEGLEILITGLDVVRNCPVKILTYAYEIEYLLSLSTTYDRQSQSGLSLKYRQEAAEKKIEYVMYLERSISDEKAWQITEKE